MCGDPKCVCPSAYSDKWWALPLEKYHETNRGQVMAVLRRIRHKHGCDIAREVATNLKFGDKGYLVTAVESEKVRDLLGS